MPATNSSSGTGTIRLQRVLKAPASRVYKAFLDADALVKWMAPNGFTAKVHSIDARVGGGYRMSFTNFSSGASHSFGGTYAELVPPPDSPIAGEMGMKITIKPVLNGSATELTIVQSNVPAAIPEDMCYLGWQESLSLLAKLVEAEIPDGP